MSRLEKRLVAAALIFVVIYLGAAAVTIHHRMTTERQPSLKIESAEPLREERHLMVAELLLPMLILLTIAVSYILVKKKREKVAAQMDAAHDDEVGEDWRQGETRPEQAGSDHGGTHQNA